MDDYSRTGVLGWKCPRGMQSRNIYQVLLGGNRSKVVGYAGGGKADAVGRGFSEAIEYLLQFCDDLVHIWSFCGIVNPHTLHQADQLRTPLPLESFC